MNSKEFKKLLKPYARKKDQKESGTGLGLDICSAILNEHGFKLDCEILSSGGTRIKIKVA
jgi:K+-sensing histidine kinase KdpD